MPEGTSIVSMVIVNKLIQKRQDQGALHAEGPVLISSALDGPLKATKNSLWAL